MTDAHRLAPQMLNALAPLDGLVTGGQPTAADLARLAGAGYRVIHDLRERAEPRGFDEAAACAALGVEYVATPVGGRVDDSLFERMRAVVRDAATTPAVVHCASGNRVGFALLPALILDRGLQVEQALALATRMGLGSPQLARIAMDYVRRVRAGEKDDAA